jgi:ribosome-associated protein
MRKPAPDPDPSLPPIEQAGSAPAQRPSKTELKRQMHELQRLGEQLVGLSPARLQRIDLPERLREQVEAARRIKSREGLRRQLQYIGRLMRAADAESIRAELAAPRRKSEAAP